ncbi:SpoIIE family protein phosphatase [Streptomyces sp. NPDC000880]
MSTGEARKRTNPAPGADRLQMLAAAGDGLEDTEVLLTALQHATAELGGLGGMAHLRAKSTAWDLRLVVSSGLPRAFTTVWRNVREDGSSAPTVATRKDGYVWLPGIRAPEQRSSGAPDPARLSGVPAGAGMAAVPLPGPQGPLGVLSVLTAPRGEPSPAQREFLEKVALWAAGRLRLPQPPSGGPSPALLEEPERGPARPPPPRAESLGAWEWDVRTGALSFEQQVLDRLGIDWERFDRRVESWVDLMHPDDQPWVLAETDEGLRTRGWYEVEYRLRRADGSYGWLRTRGEAVVEDGETVRVTGTSWNTTETHAALESVGRALRHTSDGFLSTRGDWQIEFVNAAAERLLGSSSDLTGRLLWDVPAARSVPGLEERCRRAVADGEPTGFDVLWPDTERWYHLRVLPLPGGLTLYITDITEKRLRMAAERATADRAVLVAQLTRHLAEAVTATDVVSAVADSVLPSFRAAGLVVMAVEDDRLHVVGSVGYPRGFPDRVHGLPLAAITPAGETLRTGTPQFIESADEYLARYPGTAHLAAAGHKKAWAFLPLTVSGRALGACVVSFDRPRRLSEDERTLLTAVSGLIAQALERASLYDDAMTRARELQRALLPQALPSLPAVTTAACYLPAGHGTDIGGDWYDVLPLSADRVALVIGDVMGHGMSEAAVMGRLRTAVRTLSDLELPPGEILAHLNDIVIDLGTDRFATCLYGIYDPVSGEFQYASAGQLPPATDRPDATVGFPAHGPDPPLGVAAPPLETVRTQLPEGTLLALYTDGLVESHGRDIDDGMAHLARILAHAPRREQAGDLDRLCETLTSALLPTDHQPRDDAAVLIARTHRLAPGNVATWPLPEDPIAAGQARGHVREQLAAWHLEQLEMTTELLVSELVGNVIRHAKGPILLRLLRSRTLICEVSDTSLTTPHIRHASIVDEGGRGLQLVAAMSQRWGTRYTPEGKCIWTEQLIPAEASPMPAEP